MFVNKTMVAPKPLVHSVGPRCASFHIRRTSRALLTSSLASKSPNICLFSSLDIPPGLLRFLPHKTVFEGDDFLEVQWHQPHQEYHHYHRRHCHRRAPLWEPQHLDKLKSAFHGKYATGEMSFSPGMASSGSNVNEK